MKAATEEGKVIEIDYTSRSSGPTTRRVEPYAVEKEYVAGYCHLREETRCFKLSRVRRTETTGGTFEAEEEGGMRKLWSAPSADDEQTPFFIISQVTKEGRLQDASVELVIFPCVTSKEILDRTVND